LAASRRNVAKARASRRAALSAHAEREARPKERTTA
jgi:hypothetical protein